MRLFDMGGRTALVTGSTRGIGRAIAEAMAEAGARVVVSSRTQAECDAVAAGIVAAGGQAAGIAADIGRDDEIEALADGAEAAFGQVDVLVCNAAASPYYGPFLDAPDHAFDKAIRVNVRANMRLCRRLVPGMRARRDGAVVVISSIAAFKGSDDLGLYALTKAADVQLVRNLAVACGPDNVRANGIAPALVRTDFARVLWEDEARAKRVADSYALRRLGEPDDVAGIAVMLAAPAGAWMTGQTLIVDGGWSVQD